MFQWFALFADLFPSKCPLQRLQLASRLVWSNRRLLISFSCKSQERPATFTRVSFEKILSSQLHWIHGASWPKKRVFNGGILQFFLKKTKKNTHKQTIWASPWKITMSNHPCPYDDFWGSLHLWLLFTGSSATPGSSNSRSPSGEALDLVKCKENKPVPTGFQTKPVG